MAEPVKTEVLQVTLRGKNSSTLLRVPQVGPGLTTPMVKRFADFFATSPLLSEAGQRFNGTVAGGQIITRIVTDAFQLQEEVKD
ncbi:hypothetical protein [Lacticaseibacillus hegangensis]|uniref:Uncharacterized protein n=1 Tax=Lacticaseibacillus hegangensis TaxID=2486010 RepID=A0ABW4CW93_9LACO|nr:hypothetical protein [Lacticaseibacillus hegangensis]